MTFDRRGALRRRAEASRRLVPALKLWLVAFSGCSGSTLDIGSNGRASEPAACAPTAIYEDDFSDPASLANYEFPFGQDHEIVDGVLRQSAHPGIALPDAVDSVVLLSQGLLASELDYGVEADGRIRDLTNLQGAFGLAFRGASSGEHYVFIWNGNREHALPHWQVQKNYDLILAYSYIGGSFGGGVTEPSYAFESWVHLRVEVRGTRYLCYVDVHDGSGEQQVYNVVDPTEPFEGGAPGLRSGWLYGSNFVEFDNLRVTTLCD